jgi:hypothetical protein
MLIICMNKSFYIIYTKNEVNIFVKKQEINCNVHDCKHCNCSCDKCKLDEIKVCSCGDDDCKENTICNNYEKK